MVLHRPGRGPRGARGTRTARRSASSGSAASRGAAVGHGAGRPSSPSCATPSASRTSVAPGVEAETAASLANPAFTHYLARVDGEPAAVARRATFEGASYLSSIGTAAWARGRGLGELVTLAATADAVAAGSEWTYLGVFADNAAAIRLYGAPGSRSLGEPAPDLLLVG